MITRRTDPIKVPPMYERIKHNKKLQSSQVCKTVMNFIESSAVCIEVIDNEGLWANSNNFRRSFQAYVDSRQLRSCITVTIRGNRVFLIKKSLR